MGCFQVRYDSRVVIYEHKLFIRLTTGQTVKGGIFNKKVVSSNPGSRITKIFVNSGNTTNQKISNH